MVDGVDIYHLLQEWMGITGCFLLPLYFFILRLRTIGHGSSSNYIRNSHLPVLAICSDTSKGLLNVVSKVFPHAEKERMF